MLSYDINGVGVTVLQLDSIGVGDEAGVVFGTWGGIFELDS